MVIDQYTVYVYISNGRPLMGIGISCINLGIIILLTILKLIKYIEYEIRLIKVTLLYNIPFSFYSYLKKAAVKVFLLKRLKMNKYNNNLSLSRFLI